MAQNSSVMFQDGNNKHHESAGPFQHEDGLSNDNTFRCAFRHQILFEEDLEPTLLEGSNSSAYDKCSSPDADFGGIHTFVLFEGRVTSSPVKTSITSYSQVPIDSDSPRLLLEESNTPSLECEEKIIPFDVVDEDESNFMKFKNSIDGISTLMNSNSIQVLDRNEAPGLAHEHNFTEIETSFHVNQESDLQFLVYEDQISPSCEKFEADGHLFEHVEVKTERLELDDDVPTSVVLPSFELLKDGNLMPKIETQLDKEADESQSDPSKHLNFDNLTISERKNPIVPNKVEAIDLLFSPKFRENKSQKSIVYRCKNEELQVKVTHLRLSGQPASTTKRSCREDKEGTDGRLRKELAKTTKNTCPENKNQLKVRIQTKVKDKVCEICAKPFDRVSDLKNHYIQHVIGEKLASAGNGRKLQFECPRCPEGAGAGAAAGTFRADVQCFKQHLRAHAGLTLYECTICNKTFANSSNFTKHKKVHGSPYKCNVCEKKFFTLKMLVHHERLHEQVGRLACPLCPRQFYSPSQLRRHARLKHVYGPAAPAAPHPRLPPRPLPHPRPPSRRVEIIESLTKIPSSYFSELKL